MNDTRELTETAAEKLENAVSDIFVEIQKAENITDGYINPWDCAELDDLVIKLSRIIAKVIITEKNREQK